MNIEAGKYYEVAAGGVWLCNNSGNREWPYNINGYRYDEHGSPCSPDVAPRILREVPAPLRLEVGKLYALSDGSVEWCEVFDSPPGYFAYKLGGHLYDKNGEAYSFPLGPRILHKLKVNEHMEAGQKVNAADVGRDDMADALAYGAVYGDGTRRTFKSMEDFNEWIKHGNSGARSYTDTIRDRLLGEAEEKYAARIFPQVYYHNIHSNTEPRKREIVIPDGYEKCDKKDAELHAFCGKWHETADRRLSYLTDVFIRPIAKPFKVEGDGWFRSRDGSWIKMTNESVHSNHEGWYDNGKHASGDPDLDLIAKSTPAQAKILDAL